MYYTGEYAMRVVKGKSRKVRRRRFSMRKFMNSLVGLFIASLIVIWGYIGIVVGLSILIGG